MSLQTTCPSCGTPNAPGTAFCLSCGTRLPQAAPPPPAKASGPSGALIAVGILSLAVVALLAILLTRKDGQPAAAESPTPTTGAIGSPTGTEQAGPALDATHQATQDRPYTFMYPSTWVTRSDDFDILVSTEEIEFNYIPSGTDLAQLVGVEAGGRHGSSLDDPDYQVGEMSSEPVTVSARTETTVGGLSALRLEGAIETDPDGVLLPALIYVVQGGEDWVVRLFFLGSDAAFDPALFDRIMATFTLDQALAASP